MPTKGSAYGNFRRALDTGNLTLTRAAAAELSAVNLEDSLRIALLVCEREPENAERAALRWLGRVCLERRDLTLAEAREALDALSVLVEEPGEAAATLRRLAQDGARGYSGIVDRTDGG